MNRQSMTDHVGSNSSSSVSSSLVEGLFEFRHKDLQRRSSDGAENIASCEVVVRTSDSHGHAWRTCPRQSQRLRKNGACHCWFVMRLDPRSPKGPSRNFSTDTRRAWRSQLASAVAGTSCPLNQGEGSLSRSRGLERILSNVAAQHRIKKEFICVSCVCAYNSLAISKGIH
jgi:hypothetical protein